MFSGWSRSSALSEVGRSPAYCVGVVLVSYAATKVSCLGKQRLDANGIKVLRARMLLDLIFWISSTRPAGTVHDRTVQSR